MKIAIIAARARNHVIGNGPDIPWQVKGEQRLFRDITMGGTLIMGRKTFESIGRPLPGRTTIVISRQADLKKEGCLTATSLQQGITLAKSLGADIFIAGGGEIYAQAFQQLQGELLLHLTTIDTDAEGDIFFPIPEPAEWEVLEEKHFESNINYRYQKLSRIQSDR
ncbi:MAG: dihydrofolate reductase [Pseudomonadales bacterium]|nr:dihydrofolate reductase [Pseudomonadales bacterium]